MVARNIASYSGRWGSEKQWRESARIVLDGLANPPQASRDLYLWVLALTGERVPFTKVCPHHSTPWDMIWEAYRVDLPNQQSAKKMAICVGPRDGEKTLSMAKLNVAELLLKAGCETSFVAATDLQASRCSKYMKRYLAHPAVKDLVTKSISREIQISNGSRYEQLVGGINSANSLHPHKLRTDEVELVRPRSVLEEMKMMPSSYNGITQHQIYCSTRKYVKGPMSQLFEESKSSSTSKLIWCYKEVSEPCPDSRSGTRKQIYEVPDLLHPGESLVVEAYEGCRDCPILASCRGDLKRSRGSYPIDDTITAYEKLGREHWLIQKECIEPSFTDLFFAEWDTEKQAGDYSYNPKLSLDLSFDFSGGGEDPTSVGFWQTDMENQYRVHEMVFHRKPTTFIGSQVETYCKERGINPRLMIGDSSQQQMMLDLKNYSPFFKNIRGTKKIGRKEGLVMCKKYVKDASGVRRLFVNSTCTNFISEIESASRRESDPDDFNGDDHSLDDWRYWAVEVFLHGREPRVRWLDYPGRQKQMKEEEDKKKLDPNYKKPLAEDSGSMVDRQIRRFLNED